MIKTYRKIAIILSLLLVGTVFLIACDKKTDDGHTDPSTPTSVTVTSGVGNTVIMPEEGEQVKNVTLTARADGVATGNTVEYEWKEDGGAYTTRNGENTYTLIIENKPEAYSITAQARARAVDSDNHTSAWKESSAITIQVNLPPKQAESIVITTEEIL